MALLKRVKVLFGPCRVDPVHLGVFHSTSRDTALSFCIRKESWVDHKGSILSFRYFIFFRLFFPVVCCCQICSVSPVVRLLLLLLCLGEAMKLYSNLFFLILKITLWQICVLKKKVAFQLFPGWYWISEDNTKILSLVCIFSCAVTTIS